VAPSSGNVSRFRLLLILLGLETGSHVNMDGVEFIDCTAYRFEPISEGSYNDLDGEVIESGPIQGIVLPSAMKAYCNIQP
jgi:diacylglycerol kinase family enzyme